MKRPKRPTDMNQLGKLVVDMATGQVPKDYPETVAEDADFKGNKSCVTREKSVSYKHESATEKD
ncbi:MAG: hypothetical protein OXI58_00065 [Gemmatimonadota bacterium]|nr:hypothetical protein [Gemmatimonadota bacterium]